MFTRVVGPSLVSCTIHQKDGRVKRLGGGSSSGVQITRIEV